MEIIGDGHRGKRARVFFQFSGTYNINNINRLIRALAYRFCQRSVHCSRYWSPQTEFRSPSDDHCGSGMPPLYEYASDSRLGLAGGGIPAISSGEQLREGWI
jgi:hypothetical protein